jgi:hypothetical protein
MDAYRIFFFQEEGSYFFMEYNKNIYLQTYVCAK